MSTPSEEIWVFGGNRVDSKGSHAHVWMPVGTEELLWFRARGSHTVGSEYRVQVTRHNDGNITKHGDAVYVGRHGDDAVRATFEAGHRAAETRLRLAALERNDRRHSALDEAIEPLAAIVRSAALGDRDAILAYVMRRLARAW
jgi:hypothetical protein